MKECLTKIGNSNDQTVLPEDKTTAITLHRCNVNVVQFEIERNFLHSYS